MNPDGARADRFSVAHKCRRRSDVRSRRHDLRLGRRPFSGDSCPLTYEAWERERSYEERIAVRRPYERMIQGRIVRTQVAVDFAIDPGTSVSECQVIATKTPVTGRQQIEVTDSVVESLGTTFGLPPGIAPDGAAAWLQCDQFGVIHGGSLRRFCRWGDDLAEVEEETQHGNERRGTPLHAPAGTGPVESDLHMWRCGFRSTAE